MQGRGSNPSQQYSELSISLPFQNTLGQRLLYDSDQEGTGVFSEVAEWQLS